MKNKISKYLTIVIMNFITLNIYSQSECLQEFQLLKMKSAKQNEISDFLISEGWKQNVNVQNKSEKYFDVQLDYSVSNFYLNGNNLYILKKNGYKNILIYEPTANCFNVFKKSFSNNGLSIINNSVLIFNKNEVSAQVNEIKNELKRIAFDNKRFIDEKENKLSLLNNSINQNSFSDVMIEVNNELLHLSKSITVSKNLILEFQDKFVLLGKKCLKKHAEYLIHKNQFQNAVDVINSNEKFSDQETFQTKNKLIKSILFNKIKGLNALASDLEKTNNYEEAYYKYNEALANRVDLIKHVKENKLTEVDISDYDLVHFNNKIKFCLEQIINDKLSKLQFNDLIKFQKIKFQISQDSKDEKKLNEYIEGSQIFKQRKFSSYSYSALNPNEYKTTLKIISNKIDSLSNLFDSGSLNVDLKISFDTLGHNNSTLYFTINGKKNNYTSLIDFLSPTKKLNFYISSSTDKKLDIIWSSEINKIKHPKLFEIESDLKTDNFSIRNYLLEKQIYGKFEIKILKYSIGDKSFLNYKINSSKIVGGPSSLFKSLIIPGLGKNETTHSKKGFKNLTWFALLSGISFGIEKFSNQQYNSYKSSNDLNELNNLYNSSNSFHKISIGFAISSGVIYLTEVFGNISRGNRYKARFKNELDKLNENLNFKNLANLENNLK